MGSIPRTPQMGVYAITHAPSGRQYIGASIRIADRWTYHRSRLRRACHPSASLQHDWDADGPEAFSLTVLEVVSDKESLARAEQRWIAQRQPVYNVRPESRLHYKNWPGQPGPRRRTTHRRIDPAVALAEYLTPAAIDRFWSKVHRGGPQDCWIWTGGRNRSGYGLFALCGGGGSVTFPASRIAWIATHGPVPPGLFVCHACSPVPNPSCVNPAHLYLGTPAQNSADMVRQGRSMRGDRHNTKTHAHLWRFGERHWVHRQPERVPHGEKSVHAKLTDQQALDIRARYAAGEKKLRLAKEYGVGMTTICRVVARKTFKHLP